MKIKKWKLYLSLAIILETFFVKLFQFCFLPKKYFFDSILISDAMNGRANVDGSFGFIASFFKKINIFGFDSIYQWSIFLTIIFTILILIFIYFKKKPNLIETIFLLVSVALLNIYVFNLSKDIIQFVIFIVAFGIIINKKIGNLWKVILVCLLFFIEALLFRRYYLLMIMFIVTIYIIYTIIKKHNSDDKSFIKKIVLISIIVFFLEIFIVEHLSTEYYNMIINARYSVNYWRENSPYAVTIINDLLGANKNFLIFIGNYSINIVRLLFPIELVLLSFKYLPFIIYQLFITSLLIKSKNKFTDNNILLFIIFLSFVLLSAIFEPDFGSFIRHESTIFVFLMEITHIIYSNDQKMLKKQGD